ncbi:MAG: hypothetical protein AABM67_10100 [Acidobacteriota bacterium]
MDPLLTEFDEKNWFGQLLMKLPFVRSLVPSRTDLRGTGLAKATFLMALITSALSVLCNAAIFKLRLSHPASKDLPVIVSFGYLYELNAAFLYLFLAPIFVFVGIRFIRTAQLALRGLATRGLLKTNPDYRPIRIPRFFSAPTRVIRKARIILRHRIRGAFFKSSGNNRAVAILRNDPLSIAGRSNRRLFRPAFLLLILLAAGVVITGTEFNPNSGDYWTLAFGYVQAKTIPEYRGKPLAVLGRKVNPLPGIATDDPHWREHWIVEAIERGGAVSRPEKVIYWIFIVFALGIQILFVPFIIWIFFKSIFFLRLIYKAICPNRRSRLAIELDFEDENEAFGLADLHRAYNYLVAMIFVGAAAMASVVLANVAKGSHRIVGGEGTGPFLGSIGQAITSFLPLAVFFVLGLFLFFLRLKTEEARDHVVAELDSKISKSRKRRRELEAKRKLVCAQTAWPNSNFKTWFGTTLPSYVFPYVFLTNKPEWAGKIYDTWIALADLFHKFVHPLNRAINWIFGG